MGPNKTPANRPSDATKCPTRRTDEVAGVKPILTSTWLAARHRDRLGSMPLKKTSLEEAVTSEQKDVLAEVLARAEQKGDLPIFNASLAKVRRVSSDPESHAMELAQTVMNDANLSAKLLRIANTPYYNRGLGRISSVSRAVVMLGFETIRNLCLTLKLIESFESEHPAIGMQQMLARAYLAAGFVKELALGCGLKDAEEAYLCGLLHTLGEIAVAYFVPNKFNELVDLHRTKNVPWGEAQLKVLGVPLQEVGQQLAAAWNFSTKLSSTMTRYRPTRSGTVRRDELTHALAAMGSEVVGKLYVEYDETGSSMRELILQLSNITGLGTERLEHNLKRSFEASCELAKDYGLSHRVLQPAMRATEDDLQDRLSREFAFFAANRIETSTRASGDAREAATVTASASTKNAAQAGTTVSDSLNTSSGVNDVVIVSDGEAPTSASQPPIQSATGVGGTPSTTSAHDAPAAPAAAASRTGDPLLQLSIIQEITAMVTEGAALNAVFVKVLEGLQRGVGLDRVVLVLMSPDRAVYQGRITMGQNTDPLRMALSGPFKENADLFCRVMFEGADLLIDNASDPAWASVLPAARVAALGASSFVIAGVRSGPKPIGLFYADNGAGGPSISPDQRRGFSQFIAQARLALQVRS